MVLQDKQMEPGRIAPFLLPALAVFLIAVIQFLLRRFDNNAFTGRFVIFTQAAPTAFFLSLPVGLALASLAARLSLPSRARWYALFFSAAAVSVACWSVPETNPDMSRYFTQAKHFEVYGVGYFLREWGREIQVWLDLPTMPFLYGLLFRFFGESRFVIQTFLTLLFASSVVLTAKVGKELWDEETGLRGGWLLLGVPYLIVVTPMMLTDVPSLFFLMLSLYLFLQTLEKGGMARGLAASLALVFAAFCKYTVWVMLSVLPAAALVFAVRQSGPARRMVLMRGLGVLTAAALMGGLIVAIKFEVVREQLMLLFTYQRRGLTRWSDTYVSTFLFQIHPFVTLAAVYSIILAVRKRDLNQVIVVWLVFLVFFFQLKRFRYMLPVLPMVTLMAGRGLSALKDREVRSAVTACVVAASLAMSLFAILPLLKQWSAINLKEAGEFLDTLDVDDVEVFALPQQEYELNPAILVSILDLHTRKRIIFNDDLGASSSDGDWRRSAFRYSWEYWNPRYYSSAGAALTHARAFAVISRYPYEALPPVVSAKIKGLSHTRSFTTESPLIFHRSLVRVFW